MICCSKPRDLSRGPIVKEGEADPPPNLGVILKCSYVSPKYFETVQTPLVLGREFTERDDAGGTPVVIVNQEFARRFYGSPENAIGKRFRLGQGTPNMEIVGIAKDGLYRSFYEDRRPYMFLPLYQQSLGAVTLMISATAADDLQAVVAGARREIAQMDPRSARGWREGGRREHGEPVLAARVWRRAWLRRLACSPWCWRPWVCTA